MDRDPVTQLLAMNMKRLMEERDINGTQLAEKAKLNRTAIYDIMTERSQSPKVKTVSQIAKALKVPMSDMFLTQEQVEAQDEFMRTYRKLPENEQERLYQIAVAWMPSIET